MGKIFCLMGKSSSGKDTIFKELNKYFADKLKPIISYTTRPMRIGEIEGQEYHFISEDELREYKQLGKIIEQRIYNTVQGPWYYATIDDGNIDIENNNYLLITTLEAYNNLNNYYGKNAVVPIYIDVEDGVRLERALRREKEQLNPNYDELCRRFLADNNDFSKEKLKLASVDKIYTNDDINMCVNQIIDLIMSEICE